jgi:putative transposon-encoded protein
LGKESENIGEDVWRKVKEFGNGEMVGAVCGKRYAGKSYGWILT